MNRIFRISTAALMAISALGAASLPANAASCRDAHGRFVTCPGKAPAKATKAHATKAVATAPAKRTTHATRTTPASAATGTAAKTTTAHKS